MSIRKGKTIIAGNVSPIDLANKDLSNLTSAGQAKLDEKVNKSGDTMTGNLTAISNPYPFIAQSNVLDITITPTAHQYIGYDYRDKNGTRVGWAGVVNNTNGTKYFQIQNQGGVDGFHFPMCTTKATTTSSACHHKVAVVVQNYVNGTSWYRVWSDGWCEQGGKVSGAGFSTAVVVTFLKAFANTDYSPTITNLSNQTSYIEVACGITSNTKMNVYGQSGHSLSWEAKGYLA